MTIQDVNNSVDSANSKLNRLMQKVKGESFLSERELMLDLIGIGVSLVCVKNHIKKLEQNK